MLRTWRCVSVAVLLIAAGLDASQTLTVRAPPVRQIDHIMIRTDNPSELYAFLVDTLQLPVAWPLTSPRGSKGVLWTNVTLPQFSDSDNQAVARVHVFLSEYDAAYVDVRARHGRLRQQLQAKGGGPLGIVDVKEVVMGAADLAAARRRLQRLLEPAPSRGSDAWQVGDGPAIRLVPASQDRMEALILRVASLERAKTFLRDNRLFGGDRDGRVTIDHPTLGGINLRLENE